MLFLAINNRFKKVYNLQYSTCFLSDVGEYMAEEYEEYKVLLNDYNIPFKRGREIYDGVQKAINDGSLCKFIKGLSEDEQYFLHSIGLKHILGMRKKEEVESENKHLLEMPNELGVDDDSYGGVVCTN